MRVSGRLRLLAFAGVLATGACSYLNCGSPECADDARLREAVLTQFRARPSLATFIIDVQAYHHDVYLYGLVDTELDRGRAEDVALAVPGVKKVYNGLELMGNGDH